MLHGDSMLLCFHSPVLVYVNIQTVYSLLHFFICETHFTVIHTNMCLCRTVARAATQYLRSRQTSLIVCPSSTSYRRTTAVPGRSLALRPVLSASTSDWLRTRAVRSSQLGWVIIAFYLMLIFSFLIGSSLWRHAVVFLCHPYCS